MVSVCRGDPHMTEIVCTSLYDTKTFYMMSTVANQVTWTKKLMDVFCDQLRQKVKVPFYRLSLADEYNNKMGNVDLGDQLRGYYRFDHFIRKRKWWWSFWMWAVEVCLTNSYILYKKYCNMHKIKLNYTHYEFVCEIGKAWLYPEDYFDKTQGDASLASASTTTTTASKGTKRRSSRVEAMEEPKKSKFTGFTDSTLQNNNKCFQHRLDRTKKHCPKAVKKGGKSEPRCQLHTWATKSIIRIKAGVVRCDTCQVHLCIPCFEIFHEERDLICKKVQIRQHMAQQYEEKHAEKLA